MLTYHYYLDRNPMVIRVFEQYESSSAHLDHFAHIDQDAVAKLLQLVTLSDLHFYGTPSSDELTLLASFGNVQYHEPLLSIDDI